MGGADTEISDGHRPRSRWRWPGSSRCRSARRSRGSGCGPRRRPASSAASTRTASTRAIARFVELLRRDVPRPRRPRRRRRCRERRPAAGRALVHRAHRPGQPHPRHVRSRPTTCRSLLDPIGFTVSGDRRRADGRPPVVAARQHGRDRRHRGGRPPLRLRPHRQGGCRRRRPRSPVGDASSAGAGCARCCSGSASPRRCPTRSSPRTTLARAGLDGDALRITNPLVADESVLRTSLRPGLLRAVAFNESHRRPAWRCSRSATSTRRDRGELPDEYEALGVVLAGDGGAGGDGRVAGGRRGDGRRRPRRPAARAARPAPARARRRSWPAATRSAPSARSRPTCWRRSAIAERVASLELDLRAGARPRAEAGARGGRRAGTRRATSTSPSPCPTTCRPRSWTRRSARAPAACSSTSTCSTSTAAPALADGRRSLAYRLRLQAPDRNLTDADVAEVRGTVDRRGRQAGCRAAGLTAPTCAPRRRRPTPGAGWVWVVVPMVAVGARVRCHRRRRAPSGDDERRADLRAGRAAAGRRRRGRGPARQRFRPPATIASELGPGYGEVTLGFTRARGRPRVRRRSSTASRTPRLACSAGRSAPSRPSCRRPPSTGPATRTTGPPTSCSPCNWPGRRSRPSIPTGRRGTRRWPSCRSRSRTSPASTSSPPTFATGDLTALAARIDEALSDAGASELVSSVANAVSERIPHRRRRRLGTEFLDRLHRRQHADARPRRLLHERHRGAASRTGVAKTARVSVALEVVGGVGQPGQAAGLAAQDARQSSSGSAVNTSSARGRGRARRRPRSRPPAGPGPSRSSPGTPAGR